MTTDMFHHLQYGTASIFGKNLNIPPSRIVPLSLKEISKPAEKVSIFHYLTPHQEDKFVICAYDSMLFEPAAYFRPPHTFLQSFLFLTSPKFQSVVHQPKERDIFVIRFLRDALSKYIETSKAEKKLIKKAKKLMQHILSNEDMDYDTDPRKNKFFDIMCLAIFKENLLAIIVHTNNNGNFAGTTPQTLPELNINLNKENIKIQYAIMLQLPNGYYAPFGISFA